MAKPKVYYSVINEDNDRYSLMFTSLNAAFRHYDEDSTEFAVSTMRVVSTDVYTVRKAFSKKGKKNGKVSHYS